MQWWCLVNFSSSSDISGIVLIFRGYSMRVKRAQTISEISGQRQTRKQIPRLPRFIPWTNDTHKLSKKKEEKKEWEQVGWIVTVDFVWPSWNSETKVCIYRFVNDERHWWRQKQNRWTMPDVTAMGSSRRNLTALLAWKPASEKDLSIKRHSLTIGTAIMVTIVLFLLFVARRPCNYILMALSVRC